MSWQSTFDAKGPNWDGNAAAIEEEKRLQRLMEESKKNKGEPGIDQATLDDLNREMEALYKEEQKLLAHWDQCGNAQEKVRISNGIYLVRKQFAEIKERYVRLRQTGKFEVRIA